MKVMKVLNTLLITGFALFIFWNAASSVWEHVLAIVGTLFVGLIVISYFFSTPFKYTYEFVAQKTKDPNMARRVAMEIEQEDFKRQLPSSKNWQLAVPISIILVVYFRSPLENLVKSIELFEGLPNIVALLIGQRTRTCT